MSDSSYHSAWLHYTPGELHEWMALHLEEHPLFQELGPEEVPPCMIVGVRVWFVQLRVWGLRQVAADPISQFISKQTDESIKVAKVQVSPELQVTIQKQPRSHRHSRARSSFLSLSAWQIHVPRRKQWPSRGPPAILYQSHSQVKEYSRGSTSATSYGKLCRAVSVCHLSVIP